MREPSVEVVEERRSTVFLSGAVELGAVLRTNIGRRQFLIATGSAALGFAGSKTHAHKREDRVVLSGLRVDYLEKPLGLENPRPRFSWRLESRRRNVRQTAYRIVVGSDERTVRAGHGDLWDSGRVQSERSIEVPYAGRALHSRGRYWWRIQVWEGSGREAEPSGSWWEMGLTSPDDWTARWIAVDDEIAKADREFQTQWIWGDDLEDGRPRQFRVKFQLRDDTSGGVLFLACRTYFMQILSICIDGTALPTMAPPDELIGGQYIAVGPLAAGSHVMSLEITGKNPLPVPFSPKYGTPTYGIAVLARFDALVGKPVRVASDAAWQTCLVSRLRDDLPPVSATWSAVQTSNNESSFVVDPAMHLRRVFDLDKEVTTARLHVTALGAYEARLNGQRVGNALLAPEVSEYSKRILYRVYDVKHLLQNGTNVVGLTVGDGWYGSFPGRFVWDAPPRRVIAQLETTFIDGSRQTVGTDENWLISRSPILRSELAFGEYYDARLEQRNWDTKAFDDASWGRVTVTPAPAGRLVAQASPPIRVTQHLKPQAISNPRPEVYVFDLGQNFAGWCRLRVRGKAGTRVDLRFAEELKPSGEIDPFALFGSRANDTYILRGDPSAEVFEPRFTYHGFRYVQVTGLPEAPTADTLEGIVIHSDLPIVGQLRVDHSVVQKLWRNTVWTQRSNLVGVPTDCPSRPERLGYMGDAGMFWDSAAFNMDVATFTRRQMDNARDSQYDNGALPHVAPEPVSEKVARQARGTTPVWADGGVILPWTAWRRYGDRAVIEQNWTAMNRYVQFILENNPDYLWINKRGEDIGDWCVPGQEPFYSATWHPVTPNDLVATAFWAYSTRLLSDMAEATTRLSEAERLHGLFQKIQEAFIKAFVKDDGVVGSGSQTSYILALKFGLLPESLRPLAAKRLVADIRRRGTALCTGTAATQFSLDVLVDTGYPDVAYSLLLRTEDPSWGYMIANGATTLWERWDGNLKKRYNESSHNHYHLGSVCGFIFRRIAGIDAATPGFERILIRPVLDPRVKRGGGDFDSVLGRISTDWVQSSDRCFQLDVTIPANTKAEIHLPVGSTQSAKEGRYEVSKHRDLKVLSRSDVTAVIEIGSGSYRFVVSD